MLLPFCFCENGLADHNLREGFRRTREYRRPLPVTGDKKT